MQKLAKYCGVLTFSLVFTLFAENASATEGRQCTPFKIQYQFLLAPDSHRKVAHSGRGDTDELNFRPLQLEMTSALVQQGCVSRGEKEAKVAAARIKLEGRWLDIPTSCLDELKMFPRKITLDGYGDSFSLSFDIQGKYAVLDRVEYAISYDRGEDLFSCKKWEW